MVAVKTTGTISFKDKEHVIDEILCRWWYALPVWPPPHFNYLPALEERKLALDERERGYKKVTQLDGYPGVFVDEENELHDLRPKESCPCKANLEKRDTAQLAVLLKKCYEGQLKQLKEVSKKDKHIAEVESDVRQRLMKLCSIYAL